MDPSTIINLREKYLVGYSLKELRTEPYSNRIVVYRKPNQTTNRVSEGLVNPALFDGPKTLKELVDLVKDHYVVRKRINLWKLTADKSSKEIVTEDQVIENGDEIQFEPIDDWEIPLDQSGVLVYYQGDASTPLSEDSMKKFCSPITYPRLVEQVKKSFEVLLGEITVYQYDEATGKEGALVLPPAEKTEGQTEEFTFKAGVILVCRLG